MNTKMIEQSPTFVKLNKGLIAKYFLIYRINDSYSINEFSNFNNKQQLLFQKIENKNQQLNLMYVDSVFVNILADLTLDVLLKKVTSFQDYILSKHKIKLVAESNERIYFTYKFSDFIHLLMYGDISSKRISNKKLFTDRIFCLNNNLGELEYFSFYEQKELQLKLLKEMKIEIDYSLSSISNHAAKLCLKFSI